MHSGPPISSLVASRIASQSEGVIHPRFRTRNFTLLLQNGQYIEVVCLLDHPAKVQTPCNKAIRKKAREGGGWLTWVLETEDISKVKDKFGNSAIEGHRAIPGGSDLKRRQVGVNEITDSRGLPLFIQCPTVDHPSQNGKAKAVSRKISIADTDHLSDSWFKTQILGGLNGADIEFIDPSNNESEYGIVAVQLTTPTRAVVLD